ncbi:hypothetical protein [Bacillus sp. SRB3LM]|uniref:hypothetical protein n=1 Tax=Bacillus sp. SRB3LM TaxID=2608689 RepID=UPI0018C35864|nr:hypothetical protein [Bacillus sp. SRB3LM]MBG0968059.1 hypothetical protein [Bacillus sp. SRB3LM]MBG0969957.1 hypothetical protein [Bacillus sp. SRB3LM]MBG0972746.1 hypothetical protein [Bacillus sp. SRB3LM]
MDLIIQSEGAEFTIDWVELQEMVYEEATPHSVSGGNMVVNTIGIATPLAQPGASMRASHSQIMHLSAVNVTKNKDGGSLNAIHENVSERKRKRKNPGAPSLNLDFVSFLWRYIITGQTV